MFGLKEASEDKLKKMVEKGKWDKLRKQYLDSDKTTQVALAKACAASRNDTAKIKDLAKKIDEKCFIVITNAREVLGKGFKEV